MKMIIRSNITSTWPLLMMEISFCAQDSATTYQIGETVPLQGVYCINKGYAVFRKIQIIDQNAEYSIIKKQTQYGISQYDYIVENASTVSEEDIVH